MLAEDKFLPDLNDEIALIETTPQALVVGDEELDMNPTTVALAKDGDRRAFDTLLRPLIPKLRWRAIKAVGESNADDIVQSACIKAFTKIKTFKEQAKFSSWFYAIGTNCIRMHLRSERRLRSRYVLKKDPNSGIEENSDAVNGYTLEQQVCHREQLKKALCLLEELPHGYRDPLTMQILEGLDLKKIGKTLGISPAAVKSRIHRARVALRELVSAA